MDAFATGWAVLKSMGINVNDSSAPYTDMILDGRKTIETRASDSLDPYVGREVGLIRTGKGPAKMVGKVRLGEPKRYESKEEFDRDRPKHRVPKGSKEDKSSGYGYPIRSKKKVKPKSIHSRGNIAREVR